MESRPPGFFDAGSLRLVEVMAVAVVEHRRLAGVLADLDPATDADAYAKIARVMDAQALRIGGVATKLRLSVQATTDPRAAGRAAGAVSPADRIRAAYAR